MNGKFDIVTFLCSCSNMDLLDKDNEQNTPLHAALQDFLPEKETGGKGTVLSLKQKLGKLSCARYILQICQDVKQIDVDLLQENRSGESPYTLALERYGDY